MIYPKQTKGGRGKKDAAKTSKSLGGFSDELLRQSRSVLAYSSDLAQAVRDGTMALGDAVKQADEARQAQRSVETLRTVLQAEAPDFLEAVDEGRMTLDEANGANKARQEEIEKHKRIATGNLARIVKNSLHPAGAPPERLDAMMFNDVDPRYWPPELPPLTNETVQDCIAVLSSFVKRWPEKGEIK